MTNAASKLRPLIAIAIFLAIFVGLDRAIAFGLSKLYARVETGALAGTVNYVLRQTDAQLVIFGSSRAVYHVDPEVLGKRLGLRAFNAGSPGTTIVYARGLEALLLDRGSQAELFVVHVDPHNLWSGEATRIGRLAPFYGQDPAVDALLDASSTTARWKYQIHTFRYNSMVPSILGRLVRPGASLGDGFRVMPPDRPQDLRMRNEDRLEDPGPMDPERSRIYVDFIEDAREHGVQVVFVEGPRWRPQGMSPATRDGRAHLEQLAREHGAAYVEIDESTHPVFLESKYYADVSHLTGEGAQIFSKLLADRLAEIVGTSQTARAAATPPES